MFVRSASVFPRSVGHRQTDPVLSLSEIDIANQFAIDKVTDTGHLFEFDHKNNPCPRFIKAR
jgi:hypothetical protein